MKLLVLADHEDPALWDHFTPERLRGIDLILSCGDLDADYLSYLATYFHGPVVYVPGNHDCGYDNAPPEGCINADGRIVDCGGIRILGLGGCMKYNGGGQQYTEAEMSMRAFRLIPQIIRHHGFDILLTHAPAKNQGDGTDRAHHGFEVFLRLIDRYHPRLMLHGHQHKNYQAKFVRERSYSGTRIINACGKVIVEESFP